MNVKSDSECAAATLSVDTDVPWKLCVSLWTAPIRVSDSFRIPRASVRSSNSAAAARAEQLTKVELSESGSLVS